MRGLSSKKQGASGFSSSSTAEEVTQGIDAGGLTAIVTGASSGIGVETARVIALRGAHVIMAVRNLSAGKDIKEAIMKENPVAKLDIMELDLSSMASVRKFAQNFLSLNLPLNILVNNAGVALPFSLSRTGLPLSKDGIELQFATNHLGHFLVTHLLLNCMKKTSQISNIEGRIVNVTSEGYKLAHPDGFHPDRVYDDAGYKGWSFYGRSKLSNILHANQLSNLLKEEHANITANSVHPGFILTNLFRHQPYVNAFFTWIGKYVAKNTQQGAATTCYVALHPEIAGVGGKYFADCNICRVTALASDQELAKKVWDLSMELISSS